VEVTSKEPVHLTGYGNDALRAKNGAGYGLPLDIDVNTVWTLWKRLPVPLSRCERTPETGQRAEKSVPGTD